MDGGRRLREVFVELWGKKEREIEREIEWNGEVAFRED